MLFPTYQTKPVRVGSAEPTQELSHLRVGGGGEGVRDRFGCGERELKNNTPNGNLFILGGWRVGGGKGGVPRTANPKKDARGPSHDLKEQPPLRRPTKQFLVAAAEPTQTFCRLGRTDSSIIVARVGEQTF